MRPCDDVNDGIKMRQYGIVHNRYHYTAIIQYFPEKYVEIWQELIKFLGKYLKKSFYRYIGKKDLQKNNIQIPAFLWKNVRYKIEDEKIFLEIKIQDFVN